MIRLCHRTVTVRRIGAEGTLDPAEFRVKEGRLMSYGLRNPEFVDDLAARDFIAKHGGDEDYAILPVSFTGWR